MSMDTLVHPFRLGKVSALTSAFLFMALLGAPHGRADDSGFYGGRSLAGGVPGTLNDDKGQLALEPGSVALGADATRRDGERIFGGYRFGSGFALEGAQTRFGAPASATGNETLSVAGVRSLPLGDSLTLNARIGLHRPETIAGSAPAQELSGTGVLYGVGLSLQLAENVELRAQSERFARAPGSPQASTADTFLFGAHVNF